MAFLTSTNGASAITPEDVRDLILLPVREGSIAAQCSTVISTGSHSVRFPRLLTDVEAGWVAESQELPVDDPTLDEWECVPAKVGALTVVSAEAAADTNPEAAQIIGGSLAQSLVTKLDAAFFGTLPAPAPQGLPSVDAIEIAADFSDGIEWAAGAVSQAAQVGATITSFVTSPQTALQLAMITESDGSRRNLLDNDPAMPTRRILEGRPILESRHVEPDTVWAVPAARTYVVMRQQAELATSNDAYFSSHQVAIRAVMRAGFAFPAPGLVKITSSVTP